MGRKVLLQLGIPHSCVQSLRRVRLFATPRTVTHPAPRTGILQARILEWVAMRSSSPHSYSAAYFLQLRRAASMKCLWPRT